MVRRLRNPALNRPKKRARIEDSDVEILDGPPSSSQGTNGSPSNGLSACVSSKDAYMLVYARSEQSEENLSTENQSPIKDAVPPPRALEVVNVLNAEHDKACDEFAAKEKKAREAFDQKRRMVMDIYRSWSLSSYDEDSIIVSRQALESWLLHRISKPPTTKHDVPVESSDNPPIVNGTGANEASIKDFGRSFQNDDIVCPHGRLDPSKASSMKRVKQKALDRIADEDHARFIPAFKPSDVCEECVEAIFYERMYQIRHPQDVTRFEEVDHVEPEGRGYWISKTWLRDWKMAKPKMHTPFQADPSPDDIEYIDDVKCEHGGLVTNSSSRRRISVKAYDVIRSVFPSLELPPASCEVCAVCEALVQITKEDKRGIRKQAEDEKAKLKSMYDYGVFGLASMLEGPCAVVPERFIRSWRQWVLRPTEAARPEVLDNARFSVNMACSHSTRMWMAISME
ncbi:hypothetical protein QCA50_003026 [Cerrena zonata]|uniref:Uncharacterized protein n=1 Tax=Cerrena zonata TaxID=2478898 RepID=A0AAW0GJC5_9APHY